MCSTWFRLNLSKISCWYKHCVKNVPIRSYSGPHFPEFALNMERYGVFLHIQSKCGEMQTKITPNTDTFQAVKGTLGSIHLTKMLWKLESNYEKKSRKIQQ